MDTFITLTRMSIASLPYYHIKNIIFHNYRNFTKHSFQMTFNYCEANGFMVSKLALKIDRYSSMCYLKFSSDVTYL